MRLPQVQARQSQALMERSKAKFLLLWLYIRLAAQFRNMFNIVVHFSYLGDQAPGLPMQRIPSQGDGSVSLFCGQFTFEFSKFGQYLSIL